MGAKLISNFDLSARDAGDAVSAFLKESLAKNFLRARNKYPILGSQHDSAKVKFENSNPSPSLKWVPFQLALRKLFGSTSKFAKQTRNSRL